MKRLTILLLMLVPLLLAANTYSITKLEIYDVGGYNYNASHWIEQSNLCVGAVMYGEAPDITITALPKRYIGAEWISTARHSSSFRSGVIASFTLARSATVAIALSSERPAWMSRWQATGEELTNSKGETFRFYKRKFKQGDSVSLGENGSIERPMYIVAVIPDKIDKPAIEGFNVRNYGAVDDGVTVNTAPIQQAIDDCAEQGGGRVVVDGGIFVTGSLVLRSGVTLYISAGTVLRGSANKRDYVPQRCELQYYRTKEDFQLIYAERQHHIAITGGGVIDGYGIYNGFPWRSPNQTEWARPRPIRMIECEDITVSDITIVRAPNWTQYYEACRRLKVEDVSVRSYTGVMNQDGIDISSCSDVEVRRFTVIAGDDAVCIKSLSLIPCENIVVEDVKCIYTHCNMVKIGTETHGNIRNVVVRNVVGRTNFCVAVESVDGAVVDNVLYENITLTECAAPFVIRLGNRGRVFKGGVEKAPVGEINNVTFRNIRVLKAGFALDRGGVGLGAPVAGIVGHPLRNITIEDCDLRAYGTINDRAAVYREIPEPDAAYPEFHIFGVLPSYGLWFRHVDGLTVRNVRMRLENHDIRPAVWVDDVRNYRFENVIYDSFGDSECPMMYDASRGREINQK